MAEFGHSPLDWELVVWDFGYIVYGGGRQICQIRALMATVVPFPTLSVDEVSED